MNTIQELQDSINSYLNAQKATYGANNSLNQTVKDIISHGVDSKNETWNPNLPPRP